MLDDRLIVCSSQRAISSFYKSQEVRFEEEGLMPKAMSIGEFFSSAFVIPHKSIAPARIQHIILYTILQDILKNSAKSITSLLTFEKSFLGYLQGSDFLLGFFREIASHGVEFAQIPLQDIYADYAEHLEILSEIYARFCAKLRDHGFALPYEKTQPIAPFLQSFSAVEVYLDGFLNPKEQELIALASAIVPLRIHLQTDAYNYRHFLWLNEKIEPNASYVIGITGADSVDSTRLGEILDSRDSSLDSAKIVESKGLAESTAPNARASQTPSFTSDIISATPARTLAPISALYFDIRIAQCSFVLEKVRELLESGVRGDRIAIIVPDEGFGEYLALLDSAHNLNYAMGKSLALSPKHSAFLQKLESALLAIGASAEDKSALTLKLLESIFIRIFAKASQSVPASTNAESMLESENLDSTSLESTPLKHTAPESEKLESAKPPLPHDILPFIDSLPPCPFGMRLRTQILDFLFELGMVSGELRALSWENLIALIIAFANDLHIDDVGGGQVRVMGILETRGLECDYAFVVDFNEDFIPRIKDSDMFLNSAIRQSLNMPTLKDRQDLQKHYYHQLFCNTHKQIFLTFVQNDEMGAAGMLDELQAEQNLKISNGDKQYALFAKGAMKPYVEEDIRGRIAQHTFSATSMNAFIECKRRFYYRYVLFLQEPPSDAPAKDMGNMVHEALERAYSAHMGEVVDEALLRGIRADFARMLESSITANTAPLGHTSMLKCKMLLANMKGFWKSERARALDAQNAGGTMRLIAFERAFESSIKHGGATHLLQGKIDRIDKIAPNTYMIIDYKYASKKPSENHTRQLAFYKLLLESSENARLQNGGAALFLDSRDILQGGSKAGDFQASAFQQSAFVTGVYYLRDKSPLFIPADEKMAQAREEILGALDEASHKISFAKTDKYNNCRYCPYTTMCDRA